MSVSRRSDAPRVAFLVAIALGTLLAFLVAPGAWETSRMAQEWNVTVARAVWGVIGAACALRAVLTYARRAPWGVVVATQAVITAGWAAQTFVAVEQRTSVGSIVFAALLAQSIVGLIADRRVSKAAA